MNQLHRAAAVPADWLIASIDTPVNGLKEGPPRACLDFYVAAMIAAR